MKSKVFADKFSLLMFACHLGSRAVNSSTHPSMLTSMSPVVELMERLGTANFSPFPSMDDEMVSVLLNDLSDGRKHAMSESVMCDGSMLPL